MAKRRVAYKKRRQNRLGMILVTNNTREFVRIEGLEIEDWARAL